MVKKSESKDTTCPESAALHALHTSCAKNNKISTVIEARI